VAANKATEGTLTGFVWSGKLLLALTREVILGSESCGTHNHILLSRGSLSHSTWAGGLHSKNLKKIPNFSLISKFFINFQELFKTYDEFLIIFSRNYQKFSRN
jgi:hypothetical protein